MQREHYPAQAPLPPFARDYDDAAWRIAQFVQYEEFAYGPDPYQQVAWVRPSTTVDTVLVFFHGGGWTCGYKEWNLLNAKALNEQQIGLASVGYRLAPQVTFPLNLKDCAAGVAELWRRLAQDGNPPPRMFLGGHSAGGHLAAMLALDRTWLAEQGLPDDVVCGCLPVSGVFHLGEGSGMSQRPRFLGLEPDPEIDRAASPIQHVGHQAPPFLITWGSRDFPHLVTQAQAMCQALRAAGVSVLDHVIEGADHLEAHLRTGDEQGAWPKLVASWMRSQSPRIPHK